MSTKRTIINADEELVIKGKLTIEGNVTQIETTQQVTNLEGNVFTINSDGSNTSAVLALNSNGTTATVTFSDINDSIVVNKPIIFTSGNVTAPIFVGNVIGTGYKNKLVGFEKSLRIKSCIVPTVINSSLGKIGLCICYDVNYPEYIAEFSCDLLVCPSNGWRLFPGYPYDPKKEKPHRNRALENKIYIARPYCAGWMFPLYFQGHTEIVDKNGAVLSAAKTNNKTELVIADISMEDEQLLPINQD